MASVHERRKVDQLRVCLHNDVQAAGVTTGFEHFRLEHQALPELDWHDVDLSVSLFGKRLVAPVVISPMTGGCELGGSINRRLAAAAQRLGLAMGVGSQRAAIVDPTLQSSYQVRDLAPDVLLLANLGAAQLNAGFGLPECRRAVEMIGADALYLHLNGLQEVCQPKGDRNFQALLAKMEVVARELAVPVVVKEVGWGISGRVAGALFSSGIAAIDVAGAGGTSWYVIQGLLAGLTREAAVRSPFAGWGIPTAESLRQVTALAGPRPVIASGGIRDGVDAAKALAWGATAVGIGHPLLRPATQSVDAVLEYLEQFIFELRTALFCIGAANVDDLRAKAHLLHTS